MEHIWNYADPYQFMAKVGRQEMPPLIITVAVTGGGPGKEQNPNIPETPEEQARATYEAYQAGASMVHIHARDASGADTTADPARFREINRRIRELCPDLVIGNSTGAGLNIPRDEVINILEADPEVCSLNMGPIVAKLTLRARKPPLTGRPKDVAVDHVFPVTYGEQERIARRCLEKGIKPECEVYNVSMFYAVDSLIKQDLLKKPYWIQLIFSPNNQFPTIKGVASMIDCLPPDSMFTMIGIGPFQFLVATMAILAGGHVRVGLEDNLYISKGKLATNAQLVEKVVRIARELGREIATPAQTREMLGISRTPKRY